MINNFIVEGYLSDSVNLTFDDAKKVDKASFFITNERDGGHYNSFCVVAFGRLARSCSLKLSKGKRCIVVGKVTSWVKYDELGNKQAGITINASDVSWDV